MFAVVSWVSALNPFIFHHFYFVFYVLLVVKKFFIVSFNYVKIFVVVFHMYHKFIQVMWIKFTCIKLRRGPTWWISFYQSMSNIPPDNLFFNFWEDFSIRKESTNVVGQGEFVFSPDSRKRWFFISNLN